MLIMKTVQEIITEIGGPLKLAEILGISNNTAYKIYSRGILPVWYWKRVVIACRQARVTGATYTNLVELHARKK
jgi:hypothetical protein